MDGDQPFITCSWNRLADGTYRSPFQEDDKIQAHANELWKTYKQMYYGSDAVGSVYVNNTLYCFLMKNKVSDVGEWNSVHIVNVTPNTATRSTTFAIQSNVLLLIGTQVSAHVSKHTTTTTTNNTTPSPLQYMETVGPVLESVEMELRSSLENVQLPKLKGVVMGIRRKHVPKVQTMGMSHTDMLNQAVLARAAMRKNQQGQSNN